MPVNLTNITNINGFMDVVNITNNNVGNSLGIFILMMIFGVAWLGSMAFGRDPKESFYGATLISSFLSLPLWAMGLIPNVAFFIIAVGGAGVLAFSFFRR